MLFSRLSCAQRQWREAVGCHRAGDGQGLAGLPGDFPKTGPATSREMPLAAQTEGMGRAMEQG